MRYVVLASLVLTTPTFAQQPAQQPAAPRPTYNLKLTDQEINIVQQGLLQLRGQDMIQTYADIANQMAEQLPKPDKPADAPK